MRVLLGSGGFRGEDRQKAIHAMWAFFDEQLQR